MKSKNLISEPLIGWGGDWTKKKIEILIEYAQAYLNIMKERKYWKLLYFDGFAGSGFVPASSKPEGKQNRGS